MVKKELTIYQVDAFTDQPFKGNPAAVISLESWLPDQVLQDIATENNLSETAYFHGSNGRYDLRWFTPVSEVALCGHATLASGWVLRNELGETAPTIRFMTKSGELRVSGENDTFTLDFPLQIASECPPPAGLLEALGIEKAEVLSAEDFLVVVKDEETVRNLAPDFTMMKKLPLRGVMVTAPGNDVDFVSRWFGPKVGVNEDPVTGSAHTTLAPYWADRLGKKVLQALQVSARSGKLLCEIDNDRVYITGSAVKYMEGKIVF